MHDMERSSLATAAADVFPSMKSSIIQLGIIAVSMEQWMGIENNSLSAGFVQSEPKEYLLVKDLSWSATKRKKKTSMLWLVH